MSDSLQPHGLQHARLPCSLLSSRVEVLDTGNTVYVLVTSWICLPGENSSNDIVLVKVSEYIHIQEAWHSSLPNEENLPHLIPNPCNDSMKDIYWPVSFCTLKIVNKPAT